MKRLFLMFGIVFFSHLPGAVASGAGLVLCNTSEHQIQFIMIYKHFHTWGEPPSWPLKGYFVIDGSECEQVLNGENLEAVFSISKIIEDHKSYLVPLSPGRPDQLPANGSTGIEEALCVPAEAPYEGYYKDDFKSYQNCSAGEHKVIFNLYVQTGSNMRYTVSIP